MTTPFPIYLSTILLEPHRWRAGVRPQFRPGEWMERIASSGFDGVELWERHYLDDLDAGDVIPMDWRMLNPPVCILNGYASWDDTHAAEAGRNRTLASVEGTGAKAVKFNFGKDPSRRDAELVAVRDWATRLPFGTLLLCECHPCTLAEESAVAADLLDQLGGLDTGAIVHFAAGTPDTLHHWAECLGSRLRHVHLAARDAAGAHIPLAAMADAAERLAVLKQHGNPLSWSLEFVVGTQNPDATPDSLWAAALEDLVAFRQLTS